MEKKEKKMQLTYENKLNVMPDMATGLAIPSGTNESSTSSGINPRLIMIKHHNYVGTSTQKKEK